MKSQSRNLERAEQLLREGLSIAEVRNRIYLLERLADICEEQGRGDEAKELRSQIRASAAPKRAKLDKGSNGSTFWQNLANEGLPDMSNAADMLRGAPSTVTARDQKVGRNEPCPCGSGRKFKKCCIQGQWTL